MLYILKRRGVVSLTRIIRPELYPFAIPVKICVYHLTETKVVIPAIPLVESPAICAHSGAKDSAKAAQVLHKVTAVVM